MSLIVFLILFPLVMGAVLFLLKGGNLSNWLVRLGALAIFLTTVALLAATFYREVTYVVIPDGMIDNGIFIAELLIGAFILYLGLKRRNFVVVGLIITQVAIMTAFELIFGHGIHATHDLFIDKLSILMSAVVGIIGSVICVYATGYMKDFHSSYRQEVKDQRNIFFSLIFIFLFAMFGVIFSNNLLWLYFFWEITTLCSFLLIGYKGTEESKRNAYRALAMNLIGGLAFVIGIVVLYCTKHVIELDKLMGLGKAGAMLPVVLISIAGLTKAAQYPFSSWLLGAMVAPTPVSALLHSSTMVKAGVYIILRFASVFEGTVCGFLIATIGGLTFLIASFAAISQHDAKKILAYSTIANLGLIVLCCGVGTYEAAWAAMLLIIFHAVAKCLLFLCVGVVEHKLHSRDIEDMSGLIVSMPKISVMLQIGIAGMFLAPFGMLISKWAALKALVDFNPILAGFIIFGGTATLFFWVKWLGTIITVIKPEEDMEDGVHTTEWFSLFALAVGTVGMCAFFPAVSSFLIQPYVVEIYGHSMELGKGNILIMSIMLTMVMLFPLSFLNYGKNVKVVDAYLCGANTDNTTRFRGSAGMTYDMEVRGYYLEKYFGEKHLGNIGVAVCFVLILILVGAALI